MFNLLVCRVIDIHASLIAIQMQKENKAMIIIKKIYIHKKLNWITKMPK